MKEITKEQINKVIGEETEKITNITHDKFINAINELPEDVKNNPLAYNEIAIAIAQGNAISVMREVLYKLLID